MKKIKIHFLCVSRDDILLVFRNSTSKQLKESFKNSRPFCHISEIISSRSNSKNHQLEFHHSNCTKEIIKYKFH